MYTILVAGLCEDAGKTTLACAVLSLLQEQGIAACGFKPKAGTSFWYDYALTRETLEQGRLYGNDAAMLHRFSSGSLPEEVINPVHRLWAERADDATLGGLPSFIADRVMLSEEEMLVINASLSGVDDAVAAVRRSSRASHVEEIASAEDLNRLVERRYTEAVASAAGRVGEAADCMVCESYSRVALPWQALAPTVVLVVAPGRVAAYDGAAYRDAVSLIQFREASTERAVELLQPFAHAAVPAVADDPVGRVAELPWWRDVLAGLL